MVPFFAATEYATSNRAAAEMHAGDAFVRAGYVWFGNVRKYRQVDKLPAYLGT